MKPVEIEFLVKNNTRQGLSGVSGGIDGVEKDAMDARKQIEALEAEVARLSKTMSTTPKMDQSDNIRQIETLQARIKELEEELGRVSKSAKAVSETAKNTTIVPSDATKAKSTFNGLNMSIQSTGPGAAGIVDGASNVLHGHFEQPADLHRRTGSCA